MLEQADIKRKSLEKRRQGGQDLRLRILILLRLLLVQCRRPRSLQFASEVAEPPRFLQLWMRILPRITTRRKTYGLVQMRTIGIWRSRRCVIGRGGSNRAQKD